MNPCMFSKGGNLTSTLYLLFIVHLMSLLILSHVLSAKKTNMMAILISEQLSSTQFTNTCTCLRALFLHHLRANTLFTLNVRILISWKVTLNVTPDIFLFVVRRFIIETGFRLGHIYMLDIGTHQYNNRAFLKCTACISTGLYVYESCDFDWTVLVLNWNVTITILVRMYGTTLSNMYTYLCTCYSYGKRFEHV